jgi:hypothetical protein
MPVEPPVTTAIFPANFLDMTCSSLRFKSFWLPVVVTTDSMLGSLQSPFHASMISR